jgi:hypothetical protein
MYSWPSNPYYRIYNNIQDLEWISRAHATGAPPYSSSSWMLTAPFADNSLQSSKILIIPDRHPFVSSTVLLFEACSQLKGQSKPSLSQVH